MSRSQGNELLAVLSKIDRPGSFCVFGTAPLVLPGLEVTGLGPIGLPLSKTQAKEIIGQCEQAPYGKGKQTIVDTSVRRVWQMDPSDFALSNPDWDGFIGDALKQVRTTLGLEKRKLESHLYKLLVYEKGSFFLPHRDGERLERMVATLVVVLPSAHAGGELVVRHEGQEQVFDFSSKANQLRLQYAAFYADCEHEVRKMQSGYRLCLVYNLTLAKGKKSIAAPRSTPHVEAASQVFQRWRERDELDKLAVMLDHQYTKDGLTVDTLKGTDRVKAQVLVEAAKQSGWRVYLALVTLWQSGSAEGGYDYSSRRRYWDDDDDYGSGDASDYEMGEIYDSSLSAEHWSDADGKRVPFGEIRLGEEEILSEQQLSDQDPDEEEFEGYTGNAGMTLERWYRRAAVVIWPERRHFDVLCEAGTQAAAAGLDRMVKTLRRSKRSEREKAQQDCAEFAARIIANWSSPPRSYASDPSETVDVLPALDTLGDPVLVAAYIEDVLAKDCHLAPHSTFVKILSRHGWMKYSGELGQVFGETREAIIDRNIRPKRPIDFQCARNAAITWQTRSDTTAATCRAKPNAVGRRILWCAPRISLPTNRR